MTLDFSLSDLAHVVLVQNFAAHFEGSAVHQLVLKEAHWVRVPDGSLKQQRGLSTMVEGREAF